MPPLPPGVTARQFSNALKEFGEAVGPEWVLSTDEDVKTYRDAFSPFWEESEEPIPSGAVAPNTVEQVQQVVRIANSYRIPLWAVSTGRNLGYGGAAPLNSGTIVLDLKRMNRVLEVSEANASALVEPGVSFFDLYRYIQERGLKLMLDLPQPGWGSVMGHALDRGVGQGPYEDRFGAHCGMEVVLPNGEVMRTGMGAVPGAKSWQHNPYGFGPFVDGMFAQSNFGVVTKMGFHLLPEPEALRLVTVTAPRREDVVPFVNTVGYLKNAGICPASFGIRSPRNDTGYWSASLKFYGPLKVIDAQWEHAQEKFSAIAGVQFREDALYRFPLSPDAVDRIPNKNVLGIPDLSAFGQAFVRDARPHGYGHYFLAPIIPMSGEAMLEAQDVFEQAFTELELPGRGPVGFTGWQRRSLISLISLPVEHDTGKARKNREAFRSLLRIAGEHGWGVYRTPVVFMPDAMDVYSYNNHALRRFHETIKDALDPNGILAPGKCGIWPRRLRETREARA